MRDARECVGCGSLHFDGQLVCEECAGDEVVHVAGSVFVTRDEVAAVAPDTFRAAKRRATLENALEHAAYVARSIEAMELEHPAEILELRRLQTLIARGQLLVLRGGEA